MEKCGLQLPGTCDSSDGQPAIAEPFAKSVLPSPENRIMEERGWTMESSPIKKISLTSPASDATWNSNSVYDISG